MEQAAVTESAFVRCLREVAPYVQCHRGSLFVLHVDEALLSEERLRSVCSDLLLLHRLQVRLVVVFGVRSKVDGMLRERGIVPEYSGSLRVTSGDAMDCVRSAAAQVRDAMESMLSTVALNAALPMRAGGNGRAMARVVSGNFVVAKPTGVVAGKDLQYTGQVRNVDVDGMLSALEGGSILLLPPLGYGHTGELFNLHASALAAKVAVAAAADKLVFLSHGGLCDEGGDSPGELHLAQARQLLRDGGLPDAMRHRLGLALDACDGGVRRVHFVDQRRDGALLLEMYSRDGSGTLVSVANYDQIRPAGLDDLVGILELIEPLSGDGALIPRPRQKLEDDLGNFTVMVRDGLVIACAALRRYEGSQVAEIECLAVHPEYRGAGRGLFLHDHLLRQARQGGVDRILALTTGATHWFYDLGYKDADSSALPAPRQAATNAKRGSKILALDLAGAGQDGVRLSYVG